MMHHFKTAREVSEHLLHKTGQALMSGDVDAFIPYFSLPQEIQTFDGQCVLISPEDIRCTFHAVRAHFLRIGVTDMARHCVEASFSDSETVLATHETRLLSGNVIAQKPFPVLSVLKFNGSLWQVASASYAIEDRTDHNAALMVVGKGLLPSHESG